MLVVGFGATIIPSLALYCIYELFTGSKCYYNSSKVPKNHETKKSPGKEAAVRRRNISLSINREIKKIITRKSICMCRSLVLRALF